MEIKRPAVAGTLESSDVQVSVRPTSEKENRISINSPVKVQFGHLIEAVVLKVLKTLSVEGAEVIINDRGALDATIAARLQTAVMRASEEETMDWEVAQTWKS
ncbi:citrate lyase acyl carrier protein [Fusibacter sp. JL216-2]|uniref:citrate lyase acyl carrier protein n=1 Tax=Fusibacter sp. JL216-2 TaxID=3071453 RepID=UPI003D330C71